MQHNLPLYRPIGYMMNFTKQYKIVSYIRYKIQLYTIWKHYMYKDINTIQNKIQHQDNVKTHWDMIYICV